MRRSSFVLLWCAILWLMSAPALAGALEQQMEAGNQAFWKGKYQESATAYAELENLGVKSYELYFNRGTAEARLGKLGRAIQYYEKALRLSPGDEDALYNLGVIRDFIARRASEEGRDADLAPAAGPVRALLDRFSSTGAALSFMIFVLLSFIALSVRRLFDSEFKKMFLGVTTAVLLVLMLATGLVTLGKWHQATRVHEAIATATGVLEVREGPGNSSVRFSLEEGSRVLILESRDGWLRLRDDQGRDGWAAAKHLGLI